MIEYTGVIKFYDPKKGYGFIDCDDSNRDAMFHVRIIKDARLRLLLWAGVRVKFTLAENTKQGRRAATIALHGNFTIIKLPPQDDLFYDYAVRHDLTGTVKVFKNITEAVTWMQLQDS